MPQNFTAKITHDSRELLAIVLPALRRDGMHYEINIPGFPRFFMKWSELDRYDIVDGKGLNVPDSMVLAVSDAIERTVGSNH